MPQSFDPNRNYFELFGIAPRFNLDSAALDQAYREIQGEVHPDKSAHLPAAQQREAMQRATLVNSAYRTLKSGQARVRYLLALAGAAIDEEGRAALPAEFLVEQMEWREKVEAARDDNDVAGLVALEQESEIELQRIYSELERALDREHDLAAGRAALFRLMFLDKLRADIGDAVEAIETASQEPG